MGFDLDGENPITEVGGYFRNNVWWWKPLWNYVSIVCEDILSNQDIQSGYYNDGHLIDDAKANGIANRLDILINDGQAKKYVDDYEMERKSLAQIICTFCGGTGKRKDMEVKDGCNSCHGTGWVDPFDSFYPMEFDNVKRFAQFCRESGGFRIH